MQTIRISTFLRGVLFADAATCTVTGLLSIIFSKTLGAFLQLPPALLFYAGLSLLPFAAFLLFNAARRQTSSIFVWAIILLNALWTLESFLILLAGWVTPNAFGYGFVILQAIGVAVLAGLEFVGLKRSEMLNASTIEQIS
jgi:hypothetical protein